MEKETPEQVAIRHLSETKNPYANECPNRHLYSEGYRAGFIEAKRLANLELKGLLK